MKIGLVAHDGKKQELLDWVMFNYPVLAEHELCGTGTTATLITNETGLDVELCPAPTARSLRLPRLSSKGVRRLRPDCKES